VAILTLNKTFFAFNQRKNPVSRRQNRKEFDQINLGVEKIPEHRSSDYVLDSLSQILNNQSLSPEQIAKIQLRVIDEKFNSLAKKYRFSKIDEVKNFLSKNQHLISLLEEIPSRIYQHFGNGQGLLLKVSHDPDFPQSSELWVFILTELSAKQALPLLEKFDEEWWLKNLEQTFGKLNISLDYI